MIINPVKEYTLTDLMNWFKESQEKKEELIIDPCNPIAPKFLHAKIIIRCYDDIAVLTQWLGGLKQ